MKNRDDIRDQFSPLLDGELTPEERAGVEAALAEDAELLRELDSLKRIDDLYRALPTVAAPAGFEESVGARIQPRPASGVVPTRRSARRLYWPGLAAAAVVLVGIGVFLFSLDRGTAPTQLATLRDEDSGQYMKTAAAQPEPSAPRTFSDARERNLPGTAPVAKSEVSALSAADNTLGEATQPSAAEEIEAPLGGAVEMPEVARGGVTARESVEAMDQVAATSPADVMPRRTQEAKSKQDRAAEGDAVSIERRVGLSEQNVAAPDSSAVAAAPRDDRAMLAPQPELDVANPRQAGGAVPGAPAMPGESEAAPAPATPPPPPVAANAAIPPAKEAANVGKDKLAKGMGASIYAATESTQRKIGARTFQLRDGVWYESGYEEQAAVDVKRDSQVAKDLLAKHIELKDVLALKEPVVLTIDGRWYKIEATPK